LNILVRVRIAVLERTIASGQVPTAGEIAADLDLPIEMVQEAYAKLGEGHIFVCEPGDPSRLRMANPFSAVPTPFKVSARGGSYHGNCVWDSLGIVSLLGGEGTVETSCPDCGEAMHLRVEGGELVESEGVVHFGVPARQWWDDIVFT
jgi:predicted RNA-binding Zn-ribbon protein involved in translation (DUF1610 family)